METHVRGVIPAGRDYPTPQSGSLRDTKVNLIIVKPLEAFQLRSCVALVVEGHIYMKHREASTKYSITT